MIDGIRASTAPLLHLRAHLSTRVSLNTFQWVYAEPDMLDADLLLVLDDFNRLQGGPVGADGSILGSQHCMLRRWRSSLICQYRGTGQMLYVGTAKPDVDVAYTCYERTHVHRHWLRTLVDDIDAIELDDIRGQHLDEDGLKRLGLQALELAQLRQMLTKQLIDNDDRQIPVDANIGRQMTADLSDIFDIQGWRSLVDRRLEALADRSELISTVLDRGYQTATRRQGEKLQLLFAGSVAATIVALLPALLSLAHWGRPVLTWIICTIIGLVVIWLGTVGLVLKKWRLDLFYEQPNPAVSENGH